MWQTEIEILKKYLELSILEVWVKKKANREFFANKVGLCVGA